MKGDAVTPGQAHAPHVPAKLTPTESAIGQVWQRMFELTDISADDHFFELGGDSVTAVQMIGEVEGLFDLSLPAFLVFEAPTLASLSERIDRVRLQADQQASRGVIFPLVTTGNGAPLFFNGIDLVLARQGVWTVPCPMFAIANWAAGGSFTNAKSLPSLATFYLSAMRRVQPAAPYRLAGFSAGAMIAFEMAQQLRDSGDDVDLLFLLDPMLPSDLAASGVEDAPSMPTGATLDLLFPPDRREAFWLATVRLLKDYAPRPYAARATIVWSRDRKGRDKMAGLFCPDANQYVLDATHRELFEQPGLHAWMQRLAENL